VNRYLRYEKNLSRDIWIWNRTEKKKK
jgi:hypothetical protein